MRMKTVARSHGLLAGAASIVLAMAGAGSAQAEDALDPANDEIVVTAAFGEGVGVGTKLPLSLSGLCCKNREA